MSISILTSPPPPQPPPPPPPPPPSPPLLPLLEQFNTIPHIKQIHARALRTSNTYTNQQHLHFLYTRLLHHSSISSPPYASSLLQNPILPSVAPNSFCYNTLLRAYSRDLHVSTALFLRMLRSGIAPDTHTFPFLLKSFSFFSAFSRGTQVHAQIFKLGLSDDTFVANSLIHFYSSCRRLAASVRIFRLMPLRNRVSWNAIIDAHVVNGEYEEALSLFRETDFRPDAYSLQSALCACAGLGALSLGMWAHVYIIRQQCRGGVTEDVLIQNSLVDLYFKCGAPAMARQVFDTMRLRDAASYNAMILGSATHGRVDEAMDVFDRMCSDPSVRPNSVTFVGVLSACKNGGSVSDGRRYFDAMTRRFGIEPELEHYGCLVDILSRNGMIDEALGLVSNMRCKPDAVIWRSILDGCSRFDAGVDVSESVAERVLDSESVPTSGAYVLLSKIYTSADRWNDVGLIRGLMSEKGIRKEPGCSSIETEGVVHEFVAGDTSHPRSEEIYEKLDEMEKRVALVGYRPDTSSKAPLDSLRVHSERLAIAFGLVSGTTKGMTMRILKNLRVCRDCHAVTKLISRAYGVEVIVRDRTRFHHFRDGSCSCLDQW